MFVLRSLLWLTTLTLLLPPSADGEPAPRVSIVESLYAGRTLLQDLTGVCERNPEACATSRETLALMAAKLETGAGILSAGLAASGALPEMPPGAHGTLMPEDLEPAWSLAETDF
jgi:hypothetical protein